MVRQLDLDGPTLNDDYDENGDDIIYQNCNICKFLKFMYFYPNINCTKDLAGYQSIWHTILFSVQIKFANEQKTWFIPSQWCEVYGLIINKIEPVAHNSL